MNAKRLDLVQKLNFYFQLRIRIRTQIYLGQTTVRISITHLIPNRPNLAYEIDTVRN